MSSLAFLRLASRSSSTTAFARTPGALRRSHPLSGCPGGRLKDAVAASPLAGCRSTRASSGQAEETYDEFNSRYEKEFDGVHDVFELQRNLNNVFAYDLVPSPSVIVAALKAARRVHDFPTAVRIFEGVKAKVENKHQYKEYLDELKEHRDELGVPLQEEMYPEAR
ncbi:MAG: Cytochrome c oxidase subunit 6 [Lichina confinis]|nr:MAG: Cytochrome c oxidase subunit 6 [Lichina confinis]